MKSTARIHRLHPAWQYALTALGVLAITLLRIAFGPLLQDRAPFALYYLVILTVGWFFGPGPTVFATVASLVAAWYAFVGKPWSFELADPSDGASLILFAVVGFSMAILSNAARALRERAQSGLSAAIGAQRAANAVMWTWDEDSGLGQGQRLVQLLGGEPGASVSALTDLERFVQAEDLPRYRAALAVAIDRGETFDVEYRLADRRKGERWCRTAGQVVCEPHLSASSLSAMTVDVTESHLGHEARAHLAAIVASSDDAIVGKDLTGKIRSWNAGAQRVFGYSAEEVIGKSITLLIPEERLAEEQHILERLRRGERIEHFETVRVAKDGRHLDISLTVSPIHDASGKVVGASKIARDITEQKRVQAEVARQREWFRITLSSIGDAVITTDRAGRITFMNPVAERLTAWSSAEAVGLPLVEVFALFDEKSRERVQDPCERVLQAGRVVTSTNHRMLVARDRSERPVSHTAAPIFDDRRDMLGVVLVFQDVTEQRRSEEALAEQREWFETTLESIGDAVIATDVLGRVVFMNPIAELLTGWRFDDARGRKCADVFHIVHAKTRKVAENPVHKVLEQGSVVGLANHTVLIASDGVERQIDDSGAPIRNRDGRVIGVVLVFRDVGERYRIEQERDAALRGREQLLESERHARAEAERANRLKDEFVATLSHELRTPLNAILGWTHVLQKDSQLGSDSRRGLEVIERNVRILAQLVSDLLDMSRIVSGKLRLDLQEVNLVSVIKQAIDAVRVAADAKQIKIGGSLDTTIEPTPADPARVQQIVWNLLSNAIKFTPKGGRVDVVLRRVGPGSAEIRVSDNGIGITPEFLPHLFSRFRQADSSITRSHSGLGLGLSIVRQLVELHGGTVTAESEGEGRGATFVVVLPIAPRSTAPVPTVSDEEEKRSATAHAAKLRDIHILVVEDEDDTRELVRRVLKEYGAQVTTAATAAEAVSAFQDTRPDVLVSDIGLPGMDGYDLIGRLRVMEAADVGRTPAIALTAYARVEDRTRALRAGYQAHLVKPVEPSELVATVASFSELVATRRRARSASKD